MSVKIFCKNREFNWVQNPYKDLIIELKAAFHEWIKIGFGKIQKAPLKQYHLKR